LHFLDGKPSSFLFFIKKKKFRKYGTMLSELAQKLQIKSPLLVMFWFEMFITFVLLEIPQPFLVP